VGLAAQNTGFDFPVSLPIDLSAFIEHLKLALLQARAEGVASAESVDVPALVARIKAVYILAALKQANGEVRVAEQLLGLAPGGLQEAMAIPGLC